MKVYLKVYTHKISLRYTEAQNDTVQYFLYTYMPNFWSPAHRFFLSCNRYAISYVSILKQYIYATQICIELIKEMINY